MVICTSVLIFTLYTNAKKNTNTIHCILKKENNLVYLVSVCNVCVSTAPYGNVTVLPWQYLGNALRSLRLSIFLLVKVRSPLKRPWCNMVGKRLLYYQLYIF